MDYSNSQLFSKYDSYNNTTASLFTTVHSSEPLVEELIEPLLGVILDPLAQKIVGLLKVCMDLKV